jgi:hypothetical protein
MNVNMGVKRYKYKKEYIARVKYLKIIYLLSL